MLSVRFLVLQINFIDKEKQAVSKQKSVKDVNKYEISSGNVKSKIKSFILEHW